MFVAQDLSHTNSLLPLLQTADNIPQAFADCIGGLLSVAAQNITLTIRGAPGVQLEPLMCKFPFETDVMHSHVTLGIGDLYSEETRNIVCRVTLPALDAPADNYNILQVRSSSLSILFSMIIIIIIIILKSHCCY